jgi:hypothetical protein
VPSSFIIRLAKLGMYGAVATKRYTNISFPNIMPHQVDVSLQDIASQIVKKSLLHVDAPPIE